MTFYPSSGTNFRKQRLLMHCYITVLINKKRSIGCLMVSSHVSLPFIAFINHDPHQEIPQLNQLFLLEDPKRKQAKAREREKERERERETNKGSNHSSKERPSSRKLSPENKVIFSYLLFLFFFPFLALWIVIISPFFRLFFFFFFLVW